MYKPEDVVLTTNNEIMTYEECRKYHELVERRATKQEAEDYWEECIYWEKQISEQQCEAYYHDIDD